MFASYTFYTIIDSLGDKKKISKYIIILIILFILTNVDFTNAQNIPIWREHYNLGCVYLKKGESDKAYKEFILAIEEYPNDLDSLNNLAGRYCSLGKYEEGIKYAQKAIPLDPDFDKPRFILGMAYYHQGKYKEAIDEYEPILTKRSGPAMAYYYLAASQAGLGMFENAMTNLEQALKLKLENSNILCRVKEFEPLFDNQNFIDLLNNNTGSKY